MLLNHVFIDTRTAFHELRVVGKVYLQHSGKMAVLMESVLYFFQLLTDSRESDAIWTVETADLNQTFRVHDIFLTTIGAEPNRKHTKGRFGLTTNTGLPSEIS